jgi:hypothetical protein
MSDKQIVNTRASRPRSGRGGLHNNFDHVTNHPSLRLIPYMNTNHLSKCAKLVALTAVLSYGVNLHATTILVTQPLTVPVAGPNEFSPMAFSNSTEAGMLHRAYHILATGDHDYKGHRAKAMHAVEAAAKLLGLDLRGDYKDHQVQVLSDDKLREAQGLIANVLASADVKDQKHVVKHLAEAVHQINIALDVR